jgi:phosphoglycerol transferase MdoB-like AlkP superfamily enzyme
MFKNDFLIDRLYLLSTMFIFSVIFLITMHLSKKRQLIIHFSLFIIMVIYLMVQDGYYSIFNDLFSFKELGTLQEGIESSKNMIRFSWFHGLSIVVLLTISIVIYKLPNIPTPKTSFKKGLLFSMLLLGLVSINAQYPVKAARLHTSDNYLYTSVFSKPAFMSTYGSTNLFFRDFIKTIIPNLSHQKEIDYIDAYISSHQDIREVNDYTGIFEGKNLIYIVGESFDSLVVNETLTPNLYKLQTKGWNFTNHYAPVYPRTTCDTEIIINTSLVPSIEDGPTCYVYNTNSYTTSLANRFNNEGYMTQALHNNYKDFYTRDLVYKGLGYDHFYGQQELDLTETDIRYDHIFFDKAKEKMIPNETSFFSFVLTLSGHSPYTDSNLAGKAHYAIVNAYYGDTISEALKYYMATQIEFDLMVGDILDYLEATNKLDDTVIILTADHYPYTLNQDDYEAYKNIESDYQKHQAPLYIYTKNITPMNISKLTTSFDLLPTIMNLFNLEGDYTFYTGNDIFGNTPSLVLYKDYSFYDGINHIYLSEKPTSAMEPLYIRAKSFYELSKAILRSNYLKE